MGNTIVWIRLLFVWNCILFTSCSNKESVDYYKLENLPADTGGANLKNIYGDTESPYGYHIYIPAFYDRENIVFPLLIYLHGKGNSGNSMIDPGILDSVLRHGPPYLIRNNHWDPPYPMIVVSPQCHDFEWNVIKIKRLTNYLVETYKVNEKRIYLTGISMGAFGVWRYIGTYGDSSQIVAAIPICGGGDIPKAKQFKNIPVWAFHGEEDNIVDPNSSIKMVEAINSYNPVVRAKVTMYPGIGHDSWTQTYDNTGMDTESVKYDPFNISIYEWMLYFERIE